LNFFLACDTFPIKMWTVISELSFHHLGAALVILTVRISL